jgi:hypothetical protein
MMSELCSKKDWREGRTQNNLSDQTGLFTFGCFMSTFKEETLRDLPAHHART